MCQDCIQRESQDRRRLSLCLQFVDHQTLPWSVGLEYKDDVLIIRFVDQCEQPS